jgi:hypothetical protein
MPSTGGFILLGFSVLVIAALLILLELTHLGYLVHSTIADRPRRRMFLASVAFLLTFGGVRLLVWSITHQVGPFQYVTVGGRHIHHLVWGILILLLVGYGWLAEVGQTPARTSIFLSRLIAICYGVGSALTLDEFAIWLNLDPNAYWSHADRASIDAVIIFGSVLSVGAWGLPFFRNARSFWLKHKKQHKPGDETTPPAP